MIKISVLLFASFVACLIPTRGMAQIPTMKTPEPTASIQPKLMMKIAPLAPASIPDQKPQAGMFDRQPNTLQPFLQPNQFSHVQREWIKLRFGVNLELESLMSTNVNDKDYYRFKPKKLNVQLRLADWLHLKPLINLRKKPHGYGLAIVQKPTWNVGASFTLRFR